MQKTTDINKWFTYQQWMLPSRWASAQPPGFDEGEMQGSHEIKSNTRERGWGYW